MVIKTAPSGPECPFLNQCCSLSKCSMYIYLYLYFMYTYTYTIIAGARLVPLTFTITTAEMATVMSGQECRSPFMTKDVASVLAKNVISRKTWNPAKFLTFSLFLELFSRIQSELFCCLKYLSTCWSDWLKCFWSFWRLWFPGKKVQSCVSAVINGCFTAPCRESHPPTHGLGFVL